MNTKITFYSILLMALGVYSCNNDQIKFPKTTVQQFINPAIKGIDIPFEEYTFLAEKGDTIYSKSGSFVLFPANSLVDKNGKIINGEVQILYRELSDPIDFFLSGIPMKYDSCGKPYVFESAGMCEIKASKNNIPIFVNQQAKPTIHLSSKNKDIAQNLYLLDTIQKKWIYKGKDLITEIKSQAAQNPKKKVKKVPFNLSKPNKADGKRPVISIKIDPESVPELVIYQNLKFEVVANESKFQLSDSKLVWEDVILERAKNNKTYKVTFIKGNKKVSYITRPVLEGKDYDEAMKIYLEKEKEYKQISINRLDKESKRNLKIRLANEKMNQLNLLIEARKKEFENKMAEAKKKWLIDSTKKAKEYEKNRLLFEQAEIAREQAAFAEGGSLMSNEIFRTFQITGFGTWNCDRPLVFESQIAAKFKDNNNNDLNLSNVTVVYKGLNLIHQCDQKNLPVNYNAEMMIWAVIGNKFVYLTFDDYKKCNINHNIKEYTFNMRIHPADIHSRDDIKKIVGI